MATPMGELVVLDETLLPSLAKVIRYQEAEAIKTIVFKTPIERDQYLRDSATNYGMVLSLIDDAVELKDKFQNDAVKSPISGLVLEYVVYCCNDALQTVPNYELRKSFLEKIAEHVDALVQAVKDVDPADSDRVAVITEEAEQSRDASLDYLTKYNSKASQSYSKYLKDTNTKLDDLIRTQQLKLGYDGLFEDLEDDHKFEVYNEIIEISGRGKVKPGKGSDIFGNLGIAVKIFKAGMMTWEIYSAENPLEEATRQAISIAASAGGAVLGEIVGAALATQLVGAQASALFVTAAGIAGGIVGAFIVGIAVGFIMDLIFGSGATAPISTDNHTYYVAPMPDGVKLARQIAHNNKLL